MCAIVQNIRPLPITNEHKTFLPCWFLRKLALNCSSLSDLHPETCAQCHFLSSHTGFRSEHPAAVRSCRICVCILSPVLSEVIILSAWEPPKHTAGPLLILSPTSSRPPGLENRSLILQYLTPCYGPCRYDWVHFHRPAFLSGPSHLHINLLASACPLPEPRFYSSITFPRMLKSLTTKASSFQGTKCR